jgi:hypothetical protein
MGRETEDQVSGWTTDTLHAHLETKITEMRRQLDERYETQSKASQELKDTTTERFASVNEFRGQLNDQINTFLSRGEAEVRFNALSEKVDLLKEQAGGVRGKSAGMNAALVYLFSGIAALGTIISLLVIFVT